MNDNGLGLDNPVMWDLFVAGLLKNLVFRGTGGGGDEPKPINPALQSLALASAVISLSSGSNPNPEGDDDLVHGPGGPVLHDIGVAVAVAQLGSVMADKAVGRQIQSMAAKAIGAQAEHLAQVIG